MAVQGSVPEVSYSTKRILNLYSDAALSRPSSSILSVAHSNTSPLISPTNPSNGSAAQGCSDETSQKVDQLDVDDYDDPHEDLNSNLAIYTEMADDSDDEGGEDDKDDEYEDEDDPEYIKPLLGVRIADNPDLLAHLPTEKHKRRRLDPNGPLPPRSEFDERAEFLDYKYICGILREDGGEGAEVAAISLDDERMHLLRPDGSKAVVAVMYNLYQKERTGRAAYEGESISDALVQEFKARARTFSYNKPHLSTTEEAKLNGNGEMWSEDFEGRHIPLNTHYSIAQLRRRGKHRYADLEHRYVRDDLPADPHHFALCKQGIQAARALEEYQNEDEQLQDRTPVELYERATLENGVLIRDHPTYLHDHLNDDPGVNDQKIEQTLDIIKGLDFWKREEEFKKNLSVCPSQVVYGSAIREGTEHSVMLKIFQAMAAYAGWSADDLWEAGLLNSEDAFGENREYMAAKLLHWEAQMGIYGIEAIVRYTFERVRALQCPVGAAGFLTRDQEFEINSGGPEYCSDSFEGEEISSGDEVVTKLPGFRIAARFDPQPIRHWRSNKICAAANNLPDNLVGDDPEFRKEAEEALDALIEYQDRQEPGTESHGPVPDWARPQLLQLPAKKQIYALVPAAVMGKSAQKKKTQLVLAEAPSVEKHVEAAKEAAPEDAVVVAESTAYTDPGVIFNMADAEDALIRGSENVMALPWGSHTSASSKQLTFDELNNQIASDCSKRRCEEQERLLKALLGVGTNTNNRFQAAVTVGSDSSSFVPREQIGRGDGSSSSFQKRRDGSDGEAEARITLGANLSSIAARVQIDLEGRGFDQLQQPLARPATDAEDRLLALINPAADS